MWHPTNIDHVVVAVTLLSRTDRFRLLHFASFFMIASNHGTRNADDNVRWETYVALARIDRAVFPDYLRPRVIGADESSKKNMRKIQTLLRTLASRRTPKQKKSSIESVASTVVSSSRFGARL